MGRRNYIDTESKDLPIEVVRSLPVIPVYGLFHLSFHGVYVPELNAPKREILEYMKECEKLKTVPFFTAIYEYDSGTIKAGILPIFGAKLYIIQRGLEAHKNGYGISDCKVLTKTEDNFRDFRERFIGKLTEDGFEIISGEIGIKRYKPDIRIRKNGTIRVNCSFRNREVGEENAPELRNWFSDLRRKYR